MQLEKFLSHLTLSCNWNKWGKGEESVNTKILGSGSFTGWLVGLQGRCFSVPTTLSGKKLK